MKELTGLRWVVLSRPSPTNIVSGNIEQCEEDARQLRGDWREQEREREQRALPRT